MLFFITEYFKRLQITMIRTWNPLDRMKGGMWSDTRISLTEMKKIEGEECQKILSLCGSKLFKYAEYVTSSSPVLWSDKINRSFGIHYFWLCGLSKNRWSNSDAEAMVKTMKSILSCLRSRLQGMIQTVLWRALLICL